MTREQSRSSWKCYCGVNLKSRLLAGNWLKVDIQSVKATLTLATLLVAIWPGAPSSAATFEAVAQTQDPSGGCLTGSPSSTPTSATCSESTLGWSDESYAYAELGRLGGSGTVQIADQANPTGSGFQVRSLFGASITDTLSVSASSGLVASGYLVAPIDILGTFTGSGALVVGQFGVSTTYSNLFSTDGSGALGTIADAMFPIVNGTVNFSISLAGSIYCGGGAGTGGTTDTSCSGSLDYSNSARILGVSVVDGNGNIIQGATVTSDSGFDYMKGYAPHVASVPVPATFPLLFFAIGGFGLFRNRKERRLKDVAMLEARRVAAKVSNTWRGSSNPGAAQHALHAF